MTTLYFFRGIVQEDRGFIAQPSFQITKPLLGDGSGFLSACALNFGTWNSLHSGPTGTGGGRDAWYEADVWAGLSLAHAATSLEVGYVAYASPNGVFETVQELSLSLTHDDSGWWSAGAFTGLQPSATVAFELNGQTDAGRDLGTYAELSLNPGLSFAPPREGTPSSDARVAEPRHIELSLPITLGLSLGDYFERDGRDEPFGFLSVGFAGVFPLPAALSDWSVTMGVDLLWLGAHTAALNGDDELEVVARAGASLRF